MSACRRSSSSTPMAIWPRSSYGRSRCRSKPSRNYAAVESRLSGSSMFMSIPEAKQSLATSPRPASRGVGEEREMADNPKQRNTREPSPLRQARRCGARTRSGNPCLSPAVKGKRRCRMHGGAKGSGAPRGERNGNYRHGRFTAQAIRERRILREWIKAARTAAAEVE